MTKREAIWHRSIESEVAGRMQTMLHVSSKEEKKKLTLRSQWTWLSTACFGLPRIYIGSESNKGAEEKSAENYWINNTALSLGSPWNASFLRLEAVASPRSSFTRWLLLTTVRQWVIAWMDTLPDVMRSLFYYALRSHLAVFCLHFSKITSPPLRTKPPQSGHCNCLLRSAAQNTPLPDRIHYMPTRYTVAET